MGKNILHFLINPINSSYAAQMVNSYNNGMDI
jgi:hypothetical protein